MLFISHDIHLARKIADQVVVLEQGAIVEQGAAFEVFERPLAQGSRQSLPATAATHYRQ